MFLHFVFKTERFKQMNKRFRRHNSEKGSLRKIYKFDLFIVRKYSLL